MNNVNGTNYSESWAFKPTPYLTYYKPSEPIERKRESIMSLTLRSWKTSLFGVLTLLNVIINAITAYQAGTPLDVARMMPEITLGLGLLLAKDFNATHTAPVAGTPDAKPPAAY
jgi:hypothetical protein